MTEETNTLNTEWPTIPHYGEQDKIIIFSIIENRHTLAAATDIYIDGTFHTCPQLFYQIFILPSTNELKIILKSQDDNIVII